MGKVVVINGVTLDGVMQSPAHAEEDTRGGFTHGGWAAQYVDDQALAATFPNTGAPLYIAIAGG